MTDPDTLRRLTVLETQFATAVDDLDEIKSDLRDLRDVLVGGKGAARVVAALLGGGIAFGGFLLAMLSWFGIKWG